MVSHGSGIKTRLTSAIKLCWKKNLDEQSLGYDSVSLKSTRRVQWLLQSKIIFIAESL